MIKLINEMFKFVLQVLSDIFITLMSKLIKIFQDKQKQKHEQKHLLNVIKYSVFQSMKLIFCQLPHITDSSYIYLVPLNSIQMPFLQSQWGFFYAQKFVTINVKYTAIQTLGKNLKICNTRMIAQVGVILKILNIQYEQFTYKLSTDDTIIILKRCNLSQIPIKSISKYIHQIIARLNHNIRAILPIVSPFLCLTVSNFYSENQNIQEQFNVIKLKNIKNIFQQYRIQRNKSTNIIFKRQNLTQQHQDAIRIIYENRINFMKLHYNIQAEKKNRSQIQQRIRQIDSKIIKNGSQNQNKFNNNTNKILTSIEIDKKLEEKKIKEGGGHSSIYRQKLVYRPIISIHNDIIKIDQYESKSKPQQGIFIKKQPKVKLQSQNSFQNEINMLKYLRNNHCQYIADYFIDNKHFMENDKVKQIYIKFYKSSLEKVLQNDNIILSISFRLKIFLEIANGINFLSSFKILHRDLKPNNILLDQSLKVKIIDFGSSCQVYGHNKYFVKDLRLLSTQGYYIDYDSICSQYLKKIYSQNQYQRHLLFDSYSIGKICQCIFLQNSQKQIFDPAINQTIVYISQRCLSQNPDDRLTYAQIIILLEIMIKMICKQQIKDI